MPTSVKKYGNKVGIVTWSNRHTEIIGEIIEMVFFKGFFFRRAQWHGCIMYLYMYRCMFVCMYSLWIFSLFFLSFEASFFAPTFLISLPLLIHPSSSLCIHFFATFSSLSPPAFLSFSATPLPPPLSIHPISLGLTASPFAQTHLLSHRRQS